MTTNSSAPLARIRDLHDLLGVIPHLLGFHPDESLVIIVLDGAQVQVTARVDLTDVATGGQVEMLMDRLLLRWPSATVWLVGYSASETDAWRVLQRAEDHAGEVRHGGRTTRKPDRGGRVPHRGRSRDHGRNHGGDDGNQHGHRGDSAAAHGDQLVVPQPPRSRMRTEITGRCRSAAARWGDAVDGA